MFSDVKSSNGSIEVDGGLRVRHEESIRVVKADRGK